VQAVDTNILIFAEVRSSAYHETARDLLSTLTEDAHPWAIPWPCIYELLRVLTHPRVYHPPVPLAAALRNVDRILASPSLVLLHESSRHHEVMRSVLTNSGATGNLVHDAHIAALCIEHGVAELLTGDRDFTRFAGLSVVNPFVD
jgi:toxin-antitoxin system PIN domain toxin